MIPRIMKTMCLTCAAISAFSLMLVPVHCLAQEYEIEIAPKVINLRCGGNDFSIHTNIPCGTIGGEVCLSIENAECEGDCCAVCSDRAQCDNNGNFVGKLEAEDVVEGLCLEEGEYSLVMSFTINGEPFTAGQECEMECDAGEGDDVCDLDCDTLKVIDNPKSCSSNNDDADEEGENEKTERIASRLRKLIQCMQE